MKSKTNKFINWQMYLALGSLTFVFVLVIEIIIMQMLNGEIEGFVLPSLYLITVICGIMAGGICAKMYFGYKKESGVREKEIIKKWDSFPNGYKKLYKQIIVLSLFYFSFLVATGIYQTILFRDFYGIMLLTMGGVFSATHFRKLMILQKKERVFVDNVLDLIKLVGMIIFIVGMVGFAIIRLG